MGARATVRLRLTNRENGKRQKKVKGAKRLEVARCKAEIVTCAPEAGK
jgi:hypothetical protein